MYHVNLVLLSHQLPGLCPKQPFEQQRRVCRQQSPATFVVLRKQIPLGKWSHKLGFFSMMGLKWHLQGVFNDRENYTKILNKTKTGIQKTHNLYTKDRLNNMLNGNNSFVFGTIVKNLGNTEKLKKMIIIGICKTSIISKNSLIKRIFQ